MKTTKSHFEIFKKEFIKWMDYFGLKDFHYSFHHEELEFSYAEVRSIYTGRRYEVYLNTELPDGEFARIKPNDFMKHLAFHECAECLLCGLREMASNRRFDPEAFDREVHGVINRLQNAIQFSHDIG